MNSQRLFGALVAVAVLMPMAAQADIVGTQRLEQEAQHLERTVNVSRVGYYLRDGVARFRARATDLAFCERRNDYNPYPGRPVPPRVPRYETCQVELQMVQQAFDDVDQDLASTYYQDREVYEQYLRTSDALRDVRYGGGYPGGPVEPIHLRAVGQLETIRFSLAGSRIQINQQCMSISNRYGLRAVRSLTVNGQQILRGQVVSSAQACSYVAQYAR